MTDKCYTCGGIPRSVLPEIVGGEYWHCNCAPAAKPSRGDRAFSTDGGKTWKDATKEPASDVRRYTLGWATPERNPFLPPEPAMVLGNWSPDKQSYVLSSDHDALLAARDARIAGLEAQVAALTTKSNIDQCALSMAASETRLRAEDFRKLTAENAALEGRLKEARGLLVLFQRWYEGDTLPFNMRGKVDALLASKAGEKRID